MHAIAMCIRDLISMVMALLVVNMDENPQSDHESGTAMSDEPSSLMHTCPMYARIRWLLVESRGGSIRSKILLLLRERPTNINRIAKALNLDYKTVKHHLDLLEKNGLVKRLGLRYGDVYFIEDNAYKHWDELYVLIKESLKLSDSNSNPQV